MGLYKTEGLILRERPLGEADKLLTLLTPTWGKIGAVARGARRPRSRLLGPTQLFCYGRYLLASGRSLDVVTQGEILAFPAAFHTDLTKLAYASYLVELVDAFLPERDPNPGVFALLRALLALFAARPEVELLTRIGELRLLTLLGYRPELEVCAHCGQPLTSTATTTLYFSPKEGGSLCERCLANDPAARPLSPAAWGYLRQFLRVDLSRSGVLQRWEAHREEIRQALQAYIEYHLGKRLKSLAFLAEIGEG